MQENPYKDSEEICQNLTKGFVCITVFIVFMFFPFCSEYASLGRKEVIQTHRREMEVETSVGCCSPSGARRAFRKGRGQQRPGVGVRAQPDERGAALQEGPRQGESQPLRRKT